MASLTGFRAFVRSGRGIVVPTTHSCALRRSLSTLPRLQDLDSEISHGRAFDEGSSFYEADFTPFRSYPSKSSQFKFIKKKQLSLDGFLEDLPRTLNMRQGKLAEDHNPFEGQEDPVLSLFRKLKLKQADWAPYAHFDPTRAYTRNLINTDHETFTLLLLCWNAGAESKIHDHPCDGCWLQVLQGEVQECRYEYPTEEDGAKSLQCIADERFQEGQVAFINDSIGLHKVGNPCPSVPAVTLHLYHPPFQDCKVWASRASSSVSQSGCADHFSEYGRVL